ncbi:MAG: Zn-ribbon domain-containing OB-fold protein [Candidatus Bathyarchaeota archaeon]|nr:Zn-ribbon domain-containing OB-fold protein [Candidatus Bathyarchaeota archaeon]MDH5778970.1 Zn-ribbon domain-containing OB-fold protein [Candidatus Bathyarchaeota archaeon]
MSLERFGKVNFVSEAKVREFMKFLEEGKIAGTRCKKCKKLHFPPRADCDRCLSDAVEWIPLGDKCKLLTYTNVHFGPPRFRYECPYLLGLAQFQNGLEVFAPLGKEIRKEEIKIGMDLKLTVTELMGNRIIYELRKP